MVEITSESTTKPKLDDMHCHLEFMTNGEEVAAQALETDTLLFANTVTPDSWLIGKEKFAVYPNVALGFGMHPWWVASAGADDEKPKAEKDILAASEACSAKVIEMLERYEPTILGEIGLDFGRRHLQTKEAQKQVFHTILTWASSKTKRLISLHSVHSTQEVLDELKQTGALETCTCIFHWFSGPSDLLKYAIQNGCYFSCGPRMLATGKGREYIKAIPASQLLLETDAPSHPGEKYSFSALYEELEKAAKGIAAIKGNDIIKTISQTASTLIGTKSPFRYTSLEKQA